MSTNSRPTYRWKRASLWGLVPLLAAVPGFGAVPPPEKLLPEDTLIMMTVPDFSKLRQIFQASPQRRLWEDPAMRPFKEKFLSKWHDDLVQPLERDLDVRLDDYTSLPQGQVTFAVIQNGANEMDDSQMGVVFLVDTRDKSSQLKTNLAGLHKKWVDAQKPLKTEKIRNFEFSVLSISSNDMPKTLRKFFPGKPATPEAGTEEDTKKPAAHNELVIGQAESLLVIGNSTKVVEKVVTHLSGGSMPCLGDLAAYDANHQALFRNAPAYGWINAKAFVDLLIHHVPEKKEDDAADPAGNPNPEKIVAATGFAGLKTIAFNYQNSNEGSLLQLFLGVPEANRQGLFKILAGEVKESSPPTFVPADAVKFQRWRIDVQKAWATLEKMVGDISPQVLGYLNFALDTANNAAKEKDPGFDVKKSLIGNLGDDLISYQKAARGASAADLRSPPSLFLLGSPKPDQLIAALKSILGVFSAGNPATEREFLGRKIYSIQAPTLPIPMAAGPKPSTPRTLNYAASGGYVALSTDASMLEEFLRSSDSQAKSLRETAGLTEAAQKVTGSGTTLFGYQNQVEGMRAVFELLRKDPGSVTNNPMGGLPGPLAAASPLHVFHDWVDFSLLPSFDKIAKYFSFTVYGGSASVQGLTFKFYAPVPPALKN
jgi:hypothetical protein